MLGPTIEENFDVSGDCCDIQPLCAIVSLSLKQSLAENVQMLSL